MTELPQPLSQPLPIPDPEDATYCGTLRLAVDVSDVLRRIFRVRETIPVERAGVLTLLLPKWLPGYHAPQSPIELVAGFSFFAGETQLHWSRHPTEIHAFHVSVPDGSKRSKRPSSSSRPPKARRGAWWSARRC